MDKKTLIISIPLAFISGCLFMLGALKCANHHLRDLPVKIKNKEKPETSLENPGAIAESAEEEI